MIPVILIQGSDEVLVAEAARDAAHEQLGDTAADLALEELEEASYELDDGTGWSLSPLVDAAQTPPFLTDRRVVIGRHLGRFTTQDAVAPLLDYLDRPLDTTSLILVWNKGPKFKSGQSRMPKKLTDAVNAAGGEIRKVDVGFGKAADAWLNDRIKSSAVTIDRGAIRAISDHLGDDTNRVGALLTSLEATYGPGSSLGLEEISPFLGEAGSVPPWELTDAMARGDMGTAIDKLRRMMGAGERHPLAILATLQTHYGRMLQLDGAPVGGEKEAAALLGIKGSTFPVKKAMQQGRSMGTEQVRSAIGLIADADIDLRGATAIEPQAVMEVLVARLTRISR